MKNQFDLLPDVTITIKGPLTSKCIAFGLTTFKEACRYVRNLPYGELTCQQSWSETLNENIGTSSTKHAFLKALADELEIPSELKLCVYSMTNQNTPGVGVILDKYRMQSIPEAHCYLTVGPHTFDFTRNFYDNDYMEPILSYIHEESIAPANAPETQKKMHRRIIAERFGVDRLEHIWDIRTKCIAALEH